MFRFGGFLVSAPLSLSITLTMTLPLSLPVPLPLQMTVSDAYLRLIDSCITQLKSQGPSGTCNASKEEEGMTVSDAVARLLRSTAVK